MAQRAEDTGKLGYQSRTDLTVFEDEGYKKGLGNRQVQMIAIGGAIGSGLFLGAGGRLHSAGPALMLVYAVAGVIAFLVVRAMGEMVMRRPTSGSFVSYSREFIGEKSAYFAGWMYFLNWACSGMGDVTAAAVYVKFFAPDIPQWIPALIALGVVLAVNLVSVKVFGELEFWFAAIKVAALVIFMLIAIVTLVLRIKVGGYTTGPQLIFENGGFFPAGFLAVLMILQGVVFAYAGVEMVGVAAGETENPRKVIPKAVNSVGWRIAVFYVGSVLLLVMLLPSFIYQAGESPFVTLLAKIGVPYAGILLTATIYLIGVVLNLFLPHDAFEIVTELSAVGIIGMWSMIMIAHLAMQRAVERGDIVRPDFRMPGAPYTNYVTLAFLFVVLVMTWFNGSTGKIVIYCIPLIVAALVIGWFAARGNVERIRHHGFSKTGK